MVVFEAALTAYRELRHAEWEVRECVAATKSRNSRRRTVKGYAVCTECVYTDKSQRSGEYIHYTMKKA